MNTTVESTSVAQKLLFPFQIQLFAIDIVTALHIQKKVVKKRFRNVFFEETITFSIISQYSSLRSQIFKEINQLTPIELTNAPYK